MDQKTKSKTIEPSSSSPLKGIMTMENSPENSVVYDNLVSNRSHANEESPIPIRDIPIRNRKLIPIWKRIRAKLWFKFVFRDMQEQHKTFG